MCKHTARSPMAASFQPGDSSNGAGLSRGGGTRARARGTHVNPFNVERNPSAPRRTRQPAGVEIRRVGVGSIQAPMLLSN